MEQKKELLKGYLAVAFTAFLWSLGGLFIKLVPWSAMSINAGRCLIALGLKTAVRKNVRIHFTPSVLIAGISFASTTTFFTLANKYTTSANAILLQYSAPLFIMLFSWAHTRRRPSAPDFLASLAIIGGIALCCLDSLGGGGALGNFFAVIAGISFSLMLYVNALPNANPDDANFLGFLLSVLVGLPNLVQESDFSLPVIGCVVVLGAFQLGLAYILLEYGICRISALSTVFVSAIEPILNPVWVAVFYGERIGLFAVLGGILVLGASVFHSVVQAKRTAVASGTEDGR